MATSVKLDETLKSRVQKLADSRQRSSHWVMREAIQQYVEREEAREDYRQAALASWEHYQQTGLHVTLDEADAWLESLGTADEKDVPECHT